MFSRLFASAEPSASLARRSTSYQPLSQQDVAAEQNEDGRPTSPSYGSEGPQKSHRDAAAMMLIKLGRSPDEEINISSADDARILRRIDFALIPLMLTIYFLQALDKATLSYASIFGLIEDTGLVGDQFSWLGSIVYFAQLVMQLPMAWALVKLPIGKFTSVLILGWGLSLAGMTWARNFSQLMTARFFLGAFEAGVAPSFVAITQMWWRRREQTMRIGYWYSMNGLTWVFGSLMTYWLASLDLQMKPYQVIFLFFGIITVIVSAVMFYWMPDSPTEAKFLSDDDKVIAIERLRHNQMGVMSREWRRAHFFEALIDAKTWFWVAIIFCISVPSSGIGTFGPLIIKSFVTNPYHTILFNVPVGILHMLAVTLSGYAATKWKLKGPVIAILSIPPIVGLLILLKYPHDFEHRVICLAGYLSMSTFTGITPLIYSWSAQNTAGDTKRKSTSALVFIGSSAGNVIGPLLFSPDDPDYSRGLRTNLVFFIMIIVLVGLTSVYVKWLNSSHAKRRVALGKSAVVLDLSLETAEDVERLEAVERAMREGTQRLGENDDGDVRLSDQEGDGGTQPLRTRDRTAFADITDLENEDFVFVF